MKNQKIYFWKMSPAAQIVLEGVYPKISDLFVEQPILEEVVKCID